LELRRPPVAPAVEPPREQRQEREAPGKEEERNVASHPSNALQVIDQLALLVLGPLGAVARLHEQRPEGLRARELLLEVFLLPLHDPADLVEHRGSLKRA